MLRGVRFGEMSAEFTSMIELAETQWERSEITGKIRPPRTTFCGTAGSLVFQSKDKDFIRPAAARSEPVAKFFFQINSFETRFLTCIDEPSLIRRMLNHRAQMLVGELDIELYKVTAPIEIVNNFCFAARAD